MAATGGLEGGDGGVGGCVLHVCVCGDQYAGDAPLRGRAVVGARPRITHRLQTSHTQADTNTLQFDKSVNTYFVCLRLEIFVYLTSGFI